MTKDNLIICPVYNEADTIKTFYQDLRKSFIQDVIFIDDGSTDHSKEYLPDIRDKETFLIRHPLRQGYGAALLSGFRFALKRGYRKIITIDVDLQHDPKHISCFLKKLDVLEVVLGSRYKEKRSFPDVPHIRLTINRYISRLIERLFSVRFTDPFCGYRGYRDSFLKRVDLRDPSYGLGLEIILEIIRLKVYIEEISIKAIYNNSYRYFMDGLNDPRTRLLYYLELLSQKRLEMLNEEIALRCIPVKSILCDPDIMNKPIDIL